MTGIERTRVGAAGDTASRHSAFDRPGRHLTGMLYLCFSVCVCKVGAAQNESIDSNDYSFS
jgi:hypothetical protein